MSEQSEEVQDKKTERAEKISLAQFCNAEKLDRAARKYMQLHFKGKMKTLSSWQKTIKSKKVIVI